MPGNLFRSDALATAQNHHSQTTGDQDAAYCSRHASFLAARASELDTSSLKSLLLDVWNADQEGKESQQYANKSCAK